MSSFEDVCELQFDCKYLADMVVELTPVPVAVDFVLQEVGGAMVKVNRKCTNIYLK